MHKICKHVKKNKFKKKWTIGDDVMLDSWWKLTDLRLTLLLQFNIHWGTRTIKETKCQFWTSKKMYLVRDC